MKPINTDMVTVYKAILHNEKGEPNEIYYCITAEMKMEKLGTKNIIGKPVVFVGTMTHADFMKLKI